MKLSTWFIISTILYGGFGLGLLLVPVTFMSIYGVALNDSGQLMARSLGSALLAYALIFWWSRNAVSTEVSVALLRANLIYNIVAFIVVLSATLSGVFSAMGWIPVALHVFLAAGFGYLVFTKSEKLQPTLN